MGNVWFVSTGDYSSYRVLRVFASRALAEQYAEGETGRFVEPEDSDDGFALVASLPSAVPWLRLACHISEEPGRGWDEEEARSLYPGVDEIPKFEARVSPGKRLVSPASPNGYWGAHVQVHVSGTDIERVRKVFSEKRAQAVAELDVLTATG